MKELAAAYYRVSKARDGMQAPEMYEGEIRRYCEYKQLRLAHVFSDIDFSGYRGSKQRPGLEKLIERADDYSMVIVPKLSRFGRSVSDLTRLFELFEAKGISLVFLDLNVDMTTSQGRLLRNVMSAFAEFESDVKADYSRANHLYRARQGKPGGGNAPLGYIRRDKAFEIDARKAPIVSEIFNRFVNGESQRGIAADLNTRRIPGPGGKLWSQGKVRRLIDNPAYCAWRRVEDELVAAAWEPLIGQSVWLRAQALTRQRARSHTGGGKPGYLLSGILTCAACGGKLTHRNGPRDSSNYLCRSTDGRARCDGGFIGQERADRIVTEALFDRFEAIEIRREGHPPERADVTVMWERLSLAERRDLLGLVVDRLVLLPRQKEEPRNKPRRLEIGWTDAWLVRDKEEPLPVSVVPLRELPLKTCAKCQRSLPPESFWRSPRGDGRDPRCSECRTRERRLSDVGVGGAGSEPLSVRTSRVTWQEWRRTRLLPDRD